jgi:serine/threonine-protein kinase
MSIDPVAAFVAQLRLGELLDPAQLNEVERLRATVTRPAELASELVRRGWITPYQANQAARGRAADLLLGSHIILEPLGGGGMGQVLKARHRHLHRHVALKLIRQDQRDSPDTVERFRREARLLAELRHPNIVQVHDAGQVGETWFLAMELLEGTDLDRMVRQRGPLPVGPACDHVRQAALGLQHAHERGLVHRDIKPSNLFLTSEGVKVLDLGLARPRAAEGAGQPGELTRANSVMGTPDYLAPEQALDPRRADARSDLYSLGCTLYFLLSGRPPFPEGTLAQKLLYHQQAEPTPIEQLHPEVPAALAELLRRMLAKRPEHRPASAAEVASLLAPLAGAAPPAPTTAVLPEVPVAAGAPSEGSPGGERGWTLRTDPSVLTAPAPGSLVQAGAGAPERGWTLMSESVPPAPLPHAVAGLPPGGAHTGTLTPERPPEANHRTPAPVRSHTDRRWLWAGAGGAAVVVLVIAVIVFWPRGGDGTTPVDTPPDKRKQAGGKPKGDEGKGKEKGDPGGGLEPDLKMAPLWANDTVVKLPGTVRRVAVGGGGRYLVLQLKPQWQLVVFDVPQGKIVAEVPGDADSHFAAGAKRLVVVKPKQEKLQFYRLRDGKVEGGAHLPDALLGKAIHQVTMGSASEGPLFIYLPVPEKRTLMLDLRTQKLTDVKWPHFGPTNAYGPEHMRASPDGTVLLGHGGGWAGLVKATFRDGVQTGATDQFKFSHGAFALPSADGQLVFTPDAIYSADLVETPIPKRLTVYLVPAHEPGYLVMLLTKRGELRTPQGTWSPVLDPVVSSEKLNQRLPIHNCEELRQGNDLSWVDRVHYYPRAGMFVTISGDGTRLILRRVPPR